MDLEKNIGAGAGGLAPGDPGGVALAAAQQVVATYPGPGTNPIPPGAFHDAVHNFKVAYNVWINGADTGPLAHNGNWDQAAADAMNSIPGAPAAPAAWTAGAPPAPPPVPVPDQPVATTGLPAWAKWLIYAIIAGGVVAGAIWLYRYYGKRQMLAAAEKRRPRRRGKRKKR